MPQLPPRSQASQAPLGALSRLGPHWRLVLPGAASQGTALRRWICDQFPACPARDDLLTITAEYFSNAIRYSASGQPGGLAVINLSWHPPVMRIAVIDGGGPDTPRTLDEPYTCDPDGFDERGRGRRMVEELACRTGVLGDPSCRVCWADLRWPDAPFAPESALERTLTDGIVRQERDLASRFPESTCWFGRTTWRWWGIRWAPQGTDIHTMISASSADELAAALTRLQPETIRGSASAGAASKPSPQPGQAPHPRHGRPGAAAVSPP
jgi:hypothetical protein